MNQNLLVQNLFIQTSWPRNSWFKTSRSTISLSKSSGSMTSLSKILSYATFWSTTSQFTISWWRILWSRISLSRISWSRMWLFMQDLPISDSLSSLSRYKNCSTETFSIVCLKPQEFYIQDPFIRVLLVHNLLIQNLLIWDILIQDLWSGISGSETSWFTIFLFRTSWSRTSFSWKSDQLFLNCCKNNPFLGYFEFFK